MNFKLDKEDYKMVNAKYIFTNKKYMRFRHIFASPFNTILPQTKLWLHKVSPAQPDPSVMTRNLAEVVADPK